MADTTNTTAASGAASLGEEQAFEAWYKMDCAVAGVGAKLAAKAAWQARAALAAPAAQEAEPAVPVEPTDEMYVAAGAVELPTSDDDGGSIHLNTSQVRQIWQAMRAALYAHPPRPQADAAAPMTVPEGWRLVPVKMNEAMKSALWEALDCEALFDAAWAMLLAAAPQAPAAPTASAAEREYILPVKTVADLVNNLLTMDQSLPIYAALSIQHDRRRRTITMAPTISLERVKDGRWIGEGDSLNAAVVWSKAEQPAATPAPAAGAAPSETVVDAVLALPTYRPVWLQFSATMHRDVEQQEHGWVRRSDVVSALGAAAPAQEAPARTMHITELHGTYGWDGKVRGAWSRSYDAPMPAPDAPDAPRLIGVDMAAGPDATAYWTAEPAPLTQAVCDVLAERRQQVEIEGFTPKHDDQYPPGTMARAAACYATINTYPTPTMWPWAPEWWKPRDDRSNYVRAAALLLAELERHDRAAARARQEGGAA